MAVGTPFLATDTGAARELAVDPAQVVPLEGERWIAMLTRWRNDVSQSAAAPSEQICDLCISERRT